MTLFCYFSFYHYFLLLLATIARFFLLKIEIYPNKNLIICGMELRLQIRVIYGAKYLADTFFFCSCSILFLLHFYILLSFFLPATSIASSMYEITCACVCMYVCVPVCKGARASFLEYICKLVCTFHNFFVLSNLK